MSRKSATIFGKETMPEPSTSHIGKGVALDAETAALVYIQGINASERTPPYPGMSIKDYRLNQRFYETI